jgi:hypothetical protein
VAELGERTPRKPVFSRLKQTRYSASRFRSLRTQAPAGTPGHRREIKSDAELTSRISDASVNAVRGLGSAGSPMSLTSCLDSGVARGRAGDFFWCGLASRREELSRRTARLRRCHGGSEERRTSFLKHIFQHWLHVRPPSRLSYATYINLQIR